MNRKGFTLVELLAVLIILGIVVGITVVSIISSINKAKEESEEAFVETIKDAIEIYLDSDDAKKLSYTSSGTFKKSNNREATLYKSSITFDNLFNSEYHPLSKSDFVNPNSETECSVGATINIYRDSQYVYYYCIKKEDLECLTKSGEISTLPEGVTCS